MRLRHRLMPWIAGAATAPAMFAALWLASSFRYESSDDILLVKAFMGFEGEPTHFTLYTHTLLAWVLRALSRAAPGVAWFSLFQLAALRLSSAVIVKSMVRDTRLLPDVGAARAELADEYGTLRFFRFVKD